MLATEVVVLKVEAELVLTYDVDSETACNCARVRSIEDLVRTAFVVVAKGPALAKVLAWRLAPAEDTAMDALAVAEAVALLQRVRYTTESRSYASVADAAEIDADRDAAEVVT